MKKTLILFVLAFVSISATFSWHMVEGTDKYGDKDGTFTLYDSHVTISMKDSYHSNLRVDFHFSDTGFYRSKNNSVSLKNPNGSDVLIGSYYAFGAKAYEVLSLLLNNDNTKVHLWWDYGYGGTANITISNDGLKEGLAELTEYYNRTKRPRDKWIEDETGRGYYYYSDCYINGSKYLCKISIGSVPILNYYSSYFYIDVYKYFTELLYDELYDSRHFPSKTKLTIQCGKKKQSFTYKFDSFFDTDSEEQKLSKILSNGEIAIATISLPEGELKVSFPTAEALEIFSK